MELCGNIKIKGNDFLRENSIIGGVILFENYPKDV
jgi:hypothetical protein